MWCPSGAGHDQSLGSSDTRTPPRASDLAPSCSIFSTIRRSQQHAHYRVRSQAILALDASEVDDGALDSGSWPLGPWTVAGGDLLREHGLFAEEAGLPLGWGAEDGCKGPA